MKIEDTLHLSLRIFTHNRLRTFLTVLAVGVGMGAIVFLLSLGYGFERLAIERFASDLALRSIEVKSIPDSGKILDAAAIEHIKGLSGVERVEPIVQLGARLQSDTAIIDGLVMGVDDQFFSVEGYKTELGETKLGANTMVITSAMLDLLELEPAGAIGKTYQLNITAEGAKGADKDVELGSVAISGVISDDLAATVFMPNSLLLSYAERGIQTVKILVKKDLSVKETADAITALGYEALTTIEDVASLEKAFRIARIVLGILGLVAVAVASIGLFNTMTISLLERIREVGIMKALGASDKDIWQIFLAESSLLGLFGGMAGLLLGVLFSRILNIIYSAVALRVGAESVNLFATPWYFALSVILFSLTVGILTGIYPAKRAAKLNPLEALRYE